MKILIKSLLLLCITYFLSQKSFSQTATNILSNIQQRIDSTKFLHYKSTYLSINTGVDDSVVKSNAEVWLQTLPADSIFGARFHLKGADRWGAFEYYYDGQNSYEIRDLDTSMTIFNPNKYPNDFHNPAKARMALEPFVYLLIDAKFKSTLLKNNPKILLDKSDNNWIISLLYPKDKDGDIISTNLLIDKTNYSILQILKKVFFRGITFTTKISVGDYTINDPLIKNDIPLTESYATYKRKHDNSNNKEKSANEIKSDLIGKKAPEFSFPSYDGREISLNQNKGKIVVLDFWESWCGYCIAAFPEMIKLQEKYKDMGVEVIGISTENIAEIKKLIKYNKLNYTNVFGDRTIITNYEISSRPTYILINKKSKIVLISYGDLEKVEKKIDQLIK
jgi:peroxiredoxin